MGSRINRLLLATFVALGIVGATALTTAPAFEHEVEPPRFQSLALPTSSPTPSSVSTSSRFERLMRPFQDEARRRRQAQAASDPSYWSRVDPRLNATRLNFLLFGYGETHEPPLTERAFIGSLTLFSYDYRSHSVDLISLTHDIRAPELERHLASHSTTRVGPIKIDQAYNVGGFDLLRRTLEDATGLAVDFQLAFNEDLIAGATDRVFGGLEVDVPLPFACNAFYFAGKKEPPGSFTAGRQRLTGMQVIQFIKTVPVEEHYDLRLEHNARKHLVFRALMDALQANVGDVAFLGRGAMFFTGEVANAAIAYDFDLRSLLVENLWRMITDRSSPGPNDSAVPAIARTIYIVDPASGDGGVQWVKANAKTNPVTRSDLALNRYGDTAMEVPYGGDPYAADLVVRYWPDVRRLIAARLT